MQASIAANTYVVSGPAQTKSAPPAVDDCVHAALSLLKACPAADPLCILLARKCADHCEHAGNAPRTPFDTHPSCAEVSEMMPGIMNQLGPDNMKDLRKMMGAVRGLLSQAGAVLWLLQRLLRRARSRVETSSACSLVSVGPKACCTARRQ